MSIAVSLNESVVGRGGESNLLGLRKASVSRFGLLCKLVEKKPHLHAVLSGKIPLCDVPGGIFLWAHRVVLIACTQPSLTMTPAVTEVTKPTL